MIHETNRLSSLPLFHFSSNKCSPHKCDFLQSPVNLIDLVATLSFYTDMLLQVSFILFHIYIYKSIHNIYWLFFFFQGIGSPCRQRRHLGILLHHPHPPAVQTHAPFPGSQDPGMFYGYIHFIDRYIYIIIKYIRFTRLKRQQKNWRCSSSSWCWASSYLQVSSTMEKGFKPILTTISRYNKIYIFTASFFI